MSPHIKVESLPKSEPESLRELAQILLRDTETGSKIELGKFQDRLFSALKDVASGKIKRLYVEMPPNHGKSSICSILFPAVVLGYSPEKRIMFVSNAMQTARLFSGAVKQLIESDTYQFLFPDTHPDIELGWREDEWFLKRSNPGNKDPSYTAVGVEGQIVSRRVDLIIMDDPVTLKNSRTKLKRQQMKEAINAVIETRIGPEGAMIVVGTRYHPEDYYSTLLKDPRYTVVRFTAYDKNGNALWPEKRPKKFLKDMEEKIGPSLFRALYLGDPVDMEGGVFRRKWIQIDGDEHPKLEELAIGMGLDLASSIEDTGDFFALVVIGVDRKGECWVLDTVRDRISFDKQVALIAEKFREWKPVAVALEKSAYHHFMQEEIIKLDLGINLIPSGHGGMDKRTRVLPIQGLAASEKLHIKPEMTDLLGELCDFRGMTKDRDDLLDALFYAHREIQPFMPTAAIDDRTTAGDLGFKDWKEELRKKMVVPAAREEQMREERSTMFGGTW